MLGAFLSLELFTGHLCYEMAFFVCRFFNRIKPSIP